MDTLSSCKLFSPEFSAVQRKISHKNAVLRSRRSRVDGYAKNVGGMRGRKANILSQVHGSKKLKRVKS
jgi:hypothetical protein